MAKTAFSKLGLKLNTEVNIINFNEQEIEVKQYLPMMDKVELVTKVINQSADDNGFYNPLKLKVFSVLETIYAYTNLTFTTKMKEDGGLKLYDILISSGLFDKIVECMEEEWQEIQATIHTTISNIYEYKNSAMGVLDSLSTDYDSLNFDISALQEKLADPNNLELLKGIMTKLG